MSRVTQQEIVEALRRGIPANAFHKFDWIESNKAIANRIEAHGIAPPDGWVLYEDDQGLPRHRPLLASCLPGADRGLRGGVHRTLLQGVQCMSKHTPGPWTFDKAHRIGFVVHEKNYGYIVGTQDEEGRYGAIESEANARLISAAPELLEALKEAICALEVCGKDFDYVMGKARAAITKARGEA